MQAEDETDVETEHAPEPQPDPEPTLLDVEPEALPVVGPGDGTEPDVEAPPEVGQATHDEDDDIHEGTTRATTQRRRGPG